MSSLLKAHRIAEKKDTKLVCTLLNERQHVVLVWDPKKQRIDSFSFFAGGPYILKEENGEFFIEGNDIRDKKIRQLRLIDGPGEDQKGIIEIRDKGEAWPTTGDRFARILIPIKSTS
jgi:hypothetical protein